MQNLVVSELKRENISLRRNNNFALNVFYKPNGKPYNTSQLIGAYLQVRPYKGSRVLFMEANTFNNMIVFSGNDGGILINIPFNTTRDLPAFQNAYYDLIIISNTQFATTVLEGKATIEASVGRIFNGYEIGGNPAQGGGAMATTYTIDWNYVLNKPEFATVAITGSYGDLKDKPNLFDGDYNKLTNKPTLAKVALTGDYNDLINKPSGTVVTPPVTDPPDDDSGGNTDSDGGGFDGGSESDAGDLDGGEF